MRTKWTLLAMVLGIGAAYVAYPYATLYRLGSAIQSADASTLESLINWPAVREGIKEDVCDLAAAAPAGNTDADLPPFGASFMRGIASSAIDQAVTPQALLAVAATRVPGSEVPGADGPPRGADVHVNWAFFDSPTTFLVSLRAPGQADPIKLEMGLRHGEWRVQRVWLPSDLLSSGSRT